MNPRDEIARQALDLPFDDRVHIADLLEASLHEGDLADSEIAAAWAREIDRRIGAYDSGEGLAIDMDVAIDGIRRALDERRANRNRMGTN